MYWVNTLPGRRCLLASKPADLRDGEVICELAAMLLGPQFVPQPGDRLGTGVDKEYADAERLEFALEALAKHADMPLGNRDPPSARGASGDGGGRTPGSTRRGLDRAETLVAVSAAAATISRPARNLQTAPAKRREAIQPAWRTSSRQRLHSAAIGMSTCRAKSARSMFLQCHAPRDRPSPAATAR